VLVVIRGLDPAYPSNFKKLLAKKMDCRGQPGMTHFFLRANHRPPGGWPCCVLTKRLMTLAADPPFVHLVGTVDQAGCERDLACVTISPVSYPG